MASEKSRRRWLAKVTETSDALDLEDRSSIRQSTAVTAKRRAMSMLNFCINRAGRNLPAPRKKVLDTAKSESRRLLAALPLIESACPPLHQKE